MTMLRATVAMSAFGLISLFGASRAQTQNVSLRAELLKDWSELKITMHKIAVEMPADKYGFRPAFWAAQAESIPPDSPRWQLEHEAKVTEYLGRRCLWLQGGAASLKDFEMADGVIDVDMAGSGARGFYNIYFRTQADGNGEQIYLRPHKTGLDDAQQYTPTLNGAAAWQIYNGPGFTRAVDIPRDVWFHARLEITGAQAKLYVNEPSLVMNDLKSGIRKGGVALAGAYFSNFEIRETPPVAWKRQEPAMPAATITQWSLSPSLDALERDLERPLSKSEAAAMKWQDIAAEPPGFVVINRYRRSPEVIPTFANDFSKRLEPQKGMQVIYARTTVVSDRDQLKKLNVGYSDDVSVFLNDKILYRGRSAQRFRDPGFLGIVNPENDAVYLPLKKGRNELMLAVSELTGGWGFICRFDDMDGVHQGLSRKALYRNAAIRRIVERLGVQANGLLPNAQQYFIQEELLDF